MIMHVVGDSYCSPRVCVTPKNSFWGLAATELQCTEILNYSFSGNCVDNIIHLLLNGTFDFDNSYFLIGVPPLVRYSICNDVRGLTPHNRDIHIYTPLFEECVDKVECMQTIGAKPFAETFTNDKQYVSFFNSEWNTVLNLEKIYLLDSWLRTKTCKFIILNLSSPIPYQSEWPPAADIMQKCINLDNCLLFGDTYQTINKLDGIQPVDFHQYGWQGHHGEEGNLNYYNKIVLPKMQELGWI